MVHEKVTQVQADIVEDARVDKQKTIFHALITNDQLRPEEKTTDRLEGEGVGLVAAGNLTRGRFVAAGDFGSAGLISASALTGSEQESTGFTPVKQNHQEPTPFYFYVAAHPAALNRYHTRGMWRGPEKLHSREDLEVYLPTLKDWIEPEMKERLE